MTDRLVSLRLEGFKSIKECAIDFRDLTVLIGANGSGKSNLISFFRMLSAMVAPPSGALQFFVAEAGGASVLLHDGPKKTREIEAELKFDTSLSKLNYRFRLFHAARDTLIFADEAYAFGDDNLEWGGLGAGHHESSVFEHLEVFYVRPILRDIIVYHFHDTSKEARIKARQPTHDSLRLKHDAANLAPFLLRLRDDQPDYYRRIVETIRQVAPFFQDFDLTAERDSVMLRWREFGSDTLFSAHQASDGTLRVMALITLLLLPPDSMPALLILDEPELGLHPSAIALVGGLITAAAASRQVLVATQSPLLLDQFDPGQVVVVEREGRESHYRRLDPAALGEWLDEYSLSELWNKNVLGGRP